MACGGSTPDPAHDFLCIQTALQAFKNRDVPRQHPVKIMIQGPRSGPLLEAPRHWFATTTVRA